MGDNMSCTKNARSEIINQSAIDCRLSWAARGILLYMLSQKDGWVMSINELRQQTKTSAKATGRDGVYSLIDELIASGYVARRQHRDSAGQMSCCSYYIRGIE